MTFNWLDLLLLLGCIQSIILSLLLWQKKDNNRGAVNHLLALLAVSGLILFVRATFLPVMVKFIAELLVLADVVLFLFGPLLYFFTTHLLRCPPLSKKQYLAHYLPAIVHIFCISPLIGLRLTGVYEGISQIQLQWLFLILEGAGIISFGIYLFWSIQLLQRYSKAYLQTYDNGEIPYFLKIVFATLFLKWMFWILGMISLYTSIDLFYARGSYMIFWLFTSFFIYLITYYLLRYPSLLHLPTLTAIKSPLKPRTDSTSIAHQKNRLHEHMLKQKPFISPELSLEELAAQTQINKHQLSRLINQGFDKNFFDFINQYRILFFIKAFEQFPSRKKSFLQIAYQSGFNSKSTFNRAFRKEMGCSPSEYFKNKSTTS